MDINNLRKMSQEGKSSIVVMILQYCNPKNIANEILKELEIEAKKQAMAGRNQASISYDLVHINYNHGDVRVKGVLKDLYNAETSYDLNEVGQTLKGLVEQHLEDKIKLEYKTMLNHDIPSKWWHDFRYLIASISW